MAFHPFNWFRKHSKVIFAILTIVIMFVFVFSTGGVADPFQKMLGWFGAARGQGEVVTRLYGSKVREGDLNKLVQQRKVASDFLFKHAWDGHPRALTAILDKELKADAKEDSLLRARRIAEQANARFQTLRESVRRYQDSPPLERKALEQRVATQQSGPVERDLRDLEGLANEKEFKGDTDRLALLQRLSTILGFQLWLTRHFESCVALSQGASPIEMYLGGGYRTTDEQLDFLLWKHQADRLKINFSDTDLAREINREAAGQVVLDPEKGDLAKQKGIVDFFANKRRELGQNAKAQDLVDALREEFRVALAQGILVGVEPGVREYRGLFPGSGSPAAVTPDEFFNFFRESRTTLRVDLLAVPVEKFLAQVKEEPAEDELHRRYEAFKDEVYSPASRDPGFKQPRRIAVEYVTASPDDPFYRQRARKQTEVLRLGADPRLRAGSCIGSGYLASHLAPLGAGPLAPLVARLPLIALDPVRTSYRESVMALKHPNPLFPPSSEQLQEAEREARLQIARLARPAVVASLFGVLNGATARSGNAFSALAAVGGNIAHEEVRVGTRHGLTTLALLAGNRPLPGNDIQQACAAAALWLAQQPEIAPYRVMQPVLLSALEERLADELVRENIQALVIEMAKPGNKPDEAKKYLAKAVKDFHLKLHRMPQPLTQDALVERLERNEPTGINGLMTAALRSDPELDVRNFVDALFLDQGKYIPHSLMTLLLTSFQRREMQGSEDRRMLQFRFFRFRERLVKQRQEFVYWRWEDQPEQVQSFAEARADVVRAWKMERARLIARGKAQAIENTINDRKSLAQALRVLQQEEKAGLGPIIELSDVALLVPHRDIQMQLRGEYEPYHVPDAKRRELPYPSPDMVQQLLALEREGQATVLTDAPGRTYYVAVLVAQKVPDVKAFAEVYGRTPLYDSLYSTFTRRRLEEYRRSVLEQLRREAGPVDASGRFDIPESVRKREATGPS